LVTQPGDVRNIVTSEAFSIDKELLGTVLATPKRRLVALSLDLIAVAFLQLLGWALLGGVAALLLLKIATKPPEGAVVSRARKVVVGCLGVTVLGTTVLVLAVVPFFMGRGTTPGIDPDAAAAFASVGGLGDWMAFGVGIAGLAELGTMSDPDQATEIMVRAGQGLLDVGQSPEAIEETLSAAMEGSPLENKGALVFAAMERLFPDSVDGNPDPGEGADSRFDGLDPAERESAIEHAQLVDSIAGDSLTALSAQIESLEDDLRSAENRRERVQDQLTEAESTSTVFTWIKDAADEAGLIFGWGTVYLTLFLAFWSGQTPGKKMVGIRVVRLNGSPMGLYLSLERAGGYAAGFATGLLGFAQVLWDPNRQGIHDKIAETVVIRCGKEKVPLSNFQETQESRT